MNVNVGANLVSPCCTINDSINAKHDRLVEHLWKNGGQKVFLLHKILLNTKKIK